MTYVIRRGATYSARKKVPNDLVAAFGKKELVKALGTKDRETAKRLALPIIEQWMKDFDDMRTRGEVSPESKKFAAWTHYQAALQRLEAKRQSMPTANQIRAEHDALWQQIDQRKINSDDFVGMINAFTNYELMISARSHDATLRKKRLVALRDDLVAADDSRIALAVGRFVDDNRLLLAGDGQDYRDLCNLFLRAEIEAITRSLEYDEGDYTGVPKDPVIIAPSSIMPIVNEVGEPILELFEQYALENPNGVKPDTANQARRDVSLFVQFVGPRYPAVAIRKEDVRNWKKLLLSYPVKAAELNVFKGLDITKIVAKNAKIGKPTISVGTINRHLANLSAFCAWLMNNGYLDQNPVIGLSLKKGLRSKTKVFSSDNLNTLFSSPLFVGCESASQPSLIYRAGNVLIRDHQFWIPLVMLFSGARPGEIGQLDVADIRQNDEIWIIDITDDEEGNKSLKREASRRVVPVHEELIKLGFLDYHRKMKAKGQTRLFPGAVRNARGQMCADFSRFFSRYLDKLGLKDGRGYSLYSFRHGAMDALRNAGYLDDQFKFLVGHGGKTVTSGYGNITQGTTKARAEMINAIRYEGLELSHLKDDHVI